MSLVGRSRARGSTAHSSNQTRETYHGVRSNVMALPSKESAALRARNNSRSILVRPHDAYVSQPAPPCSPHASAPAAVI